MKRFACVLVAVLWCSVAQAQTFQVATVTLTHAQIQALPSSPVEIVPAPNLGQVIRILTMSASVKTSAAYANLDPDGYIAIGTPFVDDLYLAFNEGGGTDAPFLTALLGVASHPPYYLVGSSPSQFFMRGWGIVPNPSQHVYVSGQPLIVKSWNGLGNFTGGDPADTLKITVYYTLEDL